MDNQNKRKSSKIRSKFITNTSSKMEMVFDIDHCNYTMVSALNDDYDNGKNYAIYNERYTITKDHQLYKLFVACSIQSNELYNYMNRIERKRFLDKHTVYFHQDLKTYIYDRLSWRSNTNSLYHGLLKDEDFKMMRSFDRMPACLRLGTVYDAADRWYKFMNEEYQMLDYYNKHGDTISDDLFRSMLPKLPKTKLGINRRRSFTIDPNKIKVVRNPKYIEKYKRANYKNGSRNTIENYTSLIKLPADMLNALDNTTVHKTIKELNQLSKRYDLTIPTMQGQKSKIVEIRVTPNRGIFNIDIKYRIQQMKRPTSNSYDSYGFDTSRIAGIDFGLDNLMAVANNVGAAPLLIKGKSLVAMNTYYNEKIYHLMYECGLNSHRLTNQISRLDNRRMNKMHNMMNNAVIKLVSYLDLLQCKTLVLGINDSLFNGFLKEGELVNKRPLDFNYLIRRIYNACKKSNINVVTVDEYYTSITSILDNQLPVKENKEAYRRVTNRLYITQNFGLINADVNSAMQIICKYKKDAFYKVFKKCGIDMIYNNNMSGAPIIHKHSSYHTHIVRDPSAGEYEIVRQFYRPKTEYDDPAGSASYYKAIPHSMLKDLPINYYRWVIGSHNEWRMSKVPYHYSMMEQWLDLDVQYSTILFSRSHLNISRYLYCQVMFDEYRIRCGKMPRFYHHKKKHVTIDGEKYKSTGRALEIQKLLDDMYPKYSIKQTAAPILKGLPGAGMLQPVSVEISDAKTLCILDNRRRICLPCSYIEASSSHSYQLTSVNKMIYSANYNRGIDKNTFKMFDPYVDKKRLPKG